MSETPAIYSTVPPARRRIVVTRRFRRRLQHLADAITAASGQPGPPALLAAIETPHVAELIVAAALAELARSGLLIPPAPETAKRRRPRHE